MLRAIVRLSARAMTRALEWALPQESSADYDDESRLAAAVSARTPRPFSDGSPSAIPSGLLLCSTCSTSQRPGAVHFAKPTDERPCPGSWRR